MRTFLILPALALASLSQALEFHFDGYQLAGQDAHAGFAFSNTTVVDGAIPTEVPLASFVVTVDPEWAGYMHAETFNVPTLLRPTTQSLGTLVVTFDRDIPLGVTFGGYGTVTTGGGSPETVTHRWQVDVSPVPEPASLTAMALGAATLLRRVRRR